jgi:hypothetical protein
VLSLEKFIIESLLEESLTLAQVLNLSRYFTQKHCKQILFGDLEAYLDKQSTRAWTRPYKPQKLGAEYSKTPIYHAPIYRVPRFTGPNLLVSLLPPKFFQ